MNKNKLFIFITVILILFFVMYLSLFNFCENKENNNKPIILIHDVSPIYFKDLKEIEKVINKHHYQNRTYLFLIVNHGNKYNLKDYPVFVSYLHKLEDEGYHIEFHAYNHIGYEFNCNRSVAEEKLNKSYKILKECGFNPKKIKYFIPPRYKISKDAESVFLNRNISIILEDRIIKNENGKIYEVKITNREYTWYLPNFLTNYAKNIAMIDYKISIMENKKYFLSIHPKAVNYGGGLKFLDKFLDDVD